jgi:hypothetical protein
MGRTNDRRKKKRVESTQHSLGQPVTMTAVGSTSPRRTEPDGTHDKGTKKGHPGRKKDGVRRRHGLNAGRTNANKTTGGSKRTIGFRDQFARQNDVPPFTGTLAATIGARSTWSTNGFDNSSQETRLTRCAKGSRNKFQEAAVENPFGFTVLHQVANDTTNSS